MGNCLSARKKRDPATLTDNGVAVVPGAPAARLSIISGSVRPLQQTGNRVFVSPSRVGSGVSQLTLENDDFYVDVSRPSLPTVATPRGPPEAIEEENEADLIEAQVREATVSEGLSLPNTPRYEDEEQQRLAQQQQLASLQQQQQQQQQKKRKGTARRADKARVQIASGQAGGTSTPESGATSMQAQPGHRSPSSDLEDDDNISDVMLIGSTERLPSPPISNRRGMDIPTLKLKKSTSGSGPRAGGGLAGAEALEQPQSVGPEQPMFFHVSHAGGGQQGAMQNPVSAPLPRVPLDSDRSGESGERRGTKSAPHSGRKSVSPSSAARKKRASAVAPLMSPPSGDAGMDADTPSTGTDSPSDRRRSSPLPYGRRSRDGSRHSGGGGDDDDSGHSDDDLMVPRRPKSFSFKESKSLTLNLSLVRRDDLPPDEKAMKREKLAKFENVASEITEFLYVSGYRIPEDREKLNSYGITHIINCALGIHESAFPGEFEYLSLHLSDSEGESLTYLFLDVIEFIEDARLAGGKVLVHCHQGVSRSCAFTIAYLMWRRKSTFRDTFDFVKSRRGTCNPNTGFVVQLLDWEVMSRFQDTVDAFVMTPQSPENASLLVARPVPESVSFPTLTDHSDICYIFQASDAVYIWYGRDLGARSPEVMRAEHIARRLHRFRGAPDAIVLVPQGSETENFRTTVRYIQLNRPTSASRARKRRSASTPPRAGTPTSFPGMTAEEETNLRHSMRMSPVDRIKSAEYHGVDASKVYRREQMQASLGLALNTARKNTADLGDETPTTRRHYTPGRGDGVESEPVKAKDDAERLPMLFKHPEWQVLDMFDSDDLEEEGAFVLVPHNDPETIYVWLGEYFESPESPSPRSLAQQLARDFISEHREDALKAHSPSINVVCVMQGDEGDLFWDYFLSG